MKMDLNDEVSVRLTEHGKNIWQEKYKDYPCLANKVDKYLLKTQLWDLFEVFGPHIGLLETPVFYPLEIEVVS